MIALIVAGYGSLYLGCATHIEKGSPLGARVLQMLGGWKRHNTWTYCMGQGRKLAKEGLVKDSYV